MNDLSEMPWRELMNDRREFRPGFFAIRTEITRRLAERDQLKADNNRLDALWSSTTVELLQLKAEVAAAKLWIAQLKTDKENLVQAGQIEIDRYLNAKAEVASLRASLEHAKEIYHADSLAEHVRLITTRPTK